jgi:hypothetical protein
MPSTALVVATATRWYGTARMPRALARAGFEVALLAPRGSLAEHSRYVSRLGSLDDPTTPLQWLFAFAAIVKATAPRLVIPGDDMALQLLLELVIAPPAQLQPAVELALGRLIRDSLGDPQHYRSSIDKTLLPPLARSLGITVAPFEVVSRAEQAHAFADRHGYPVVVKRRQSSAGAGVAVCASADAVTEAMERFAQRVPEDLTFPGDTAMLVQAHVQGRTLFYPSAAWKGTLLTGYAGEKLQSMAGPTSPPTVNRYFRSPALRAVSATLAANLGISGFYSPEFIEDGNSGEVYLMEINRRLVGGAHRGSAIGVDHCAALHAALHGTPMTTRADLDASEQHHTVHFPQEWLRDPDSHWLRDYPADVPWDDPALIEAMLALRLA